MRFSALFLCFFVWCTSLYARDAIAVVSDNNGVTLTFDALQAHVEQGREVSAHIVNSRFAVPRLPRTHALDIVEVLVAVPDGGVQTPVLLLGGETSLGTVKLAATGGKGTTLPAVLEPTATVRMVGKQRGVVVAALTVNPYRYNPQTGQLSCITSARVVLPYAKPLALTTAKTSAAERDAALFASLVNANALSALREQRASAAKPPALQVDEGNEWYIPDAVYAKLTTTRDGVARVSYSDLAAVEPAFSGVATERLQLFLAGTEQAMYVANDGDGFFNSGDELYFMGRRAYGDTTWFDAYTNECAFFLMLGDGSKPAKRLSFVEQPQAEVKLGTVHVDWHIEQEHLYYLGDDTGLDHTSSLHRSQTVQGEGWYWDSFTYDPNNKSAVEYQHVLTPSDAPNTALTIGYHVHSLSNNRTYQPNHLGVYELNSVEVGRDEPYSGFRDIAFLKSVNSSALLAGANSLRLRALGVPEHRTQPNYTEISALDYFSIRGDAKPYAYRGALAFSTIELTHNTGIVMPGFSAATVYALDTTRGMLWRSQGQAGTTIRLGAQNTSAKVATIVVNDSVAVYATAPGLYLVRVPVAQPSTMTVHTYSNPAAQIQEIANDVQAADANSVLAVAFVGSSLPTELKTLFQNAGSNHVQSIAGDAAWVFAVQKGNPAAVDGISATTTSGSAFLPSALGQSYSAEVVMPSDGFGARYNLVANDDNTVERAGVLAVHKGTLKDPALKADVLMITHRDFKEQVDSLARYRRAKNKLDVRVIDVEDIYKQFSFGRTSPHAIKAFLQYAWNNWQQPKPSYIVLFGDASWDPRNVSEGAITHNFVPTFGRPVSDYWYTLLDGGEDDLLPEMAIGRISVETPAQAQAVVDKIVEYEALPKQPWMKKFLMLAGGKNSPGRRERDIFRDHTIRDYEQHLLATPLCAEVDTVFKPDDNEASVSKATTIRGKINDGVVWVSYVGHASPVTFDMDFGKASDLNNGNRYPVLATYSCQTAAFGEPYVTGKNEDFVREAGKGFIGAFGTTGFGEVSVDRELAWELYKSMRFDSLRALGDMLFAVKTKMAGFGSQELTYQNTIFQHSLIGDPLVRLALEREPDLYALQGDIQVVNKAGVAVIAENDSVARISAVLRNAGPQSKFYEGDTALVPIQVLVVRSYGVDKDSVWLSFDEVCRDVDFSLQVGVTGKPGLHYLALYIDPKGETPDANRSNNVVLDTFIVYPSRAFVLDPLPYWNVESQTPVFRMVNPLNIGVLSMEFAVSRDGNPNTAFYHSTPQEIVSAEQYTDWQPPSLSLTEGASYWLHVRSKDAQGEEGSWQAIPFTASHNVPTTEVEWTIRRAGHLTNENIENLTVQETGDRMEITLENNPVPVVVRSNGHGHTLQRDIFVSVDGEQLIDKTAFHGGFNIFVFPRGSTKHRAYRWYDTFAAPNPESMGNSSDMIRFLRDSVDTGEIVVLGVMDDAFTGPVEKQKNLDTLVETLKLFGAQLADSILARAAGGGSYNTSYALVGKKDGVLIAEAWQPRNAEGIGVEIETAVDIENFRGRMHLPIAGPATAWKLFRVQAENVDISARVVVTTIGRTREGSEEELFTTTATVVDISGVDAGLYPYLRFRVDVERQETTKTPVLTGLQCSFTPTAELAVLFGETGMVKDSILRGETAALQLKVQNISRRVASQPFTVVTEVRAGQPYSAPPVDIPVDIPLLDANQTHAYTQDIGTAELAPVSDIAANVRATERELYEFNNKKEYVFHIAEDNEKPSIVVLMDDVQVHDGEYVAEKPRTVVQLLDNSPLPIADERKLLVSLNGKFSNSDNTPLENYTFSSVQNGTERARAEFMARLEKGDNSLRIIAEDATGNRDTTYMVVFVSTTPTIKKLKLYPNPTSSEAQVSFMIADNQKPVGGTIVVYSTTGRLVRHDRITPRVGTNSFVWDATDDEGKRVASGVYLIKIFVQGANGLIESETRKVVFIQ